MLLGVILGLLGGGIATFAIQKVMLKSKSEKLIKDAQIEAENIKKENQDKKESLLQELQTLENPNKKRVEKTFIFRVYWVLYLRNFSSY